MTGTFPSTLGPVVGFDYEVLVETAIRPLYGGAIASYFNGLKMSPASKATFFVIGNNYDSYMTMRMT